MLEVAVRVRRCQACVQDKWSDRCDDREVSSSLLLSLSGGASVGPRLTEGPFPLLRGKHDMSGFRQHVFDFQFLNACFFSFAHV